ncbi:hypothetical protein LTR56_019218 [Elasticomyces elasticus]|nr:hypothetical protein LTR56_019218 [Elasticomyces elasticus]KAK3633226.1 hypothetical protein LTR22_020226 [Elasticomyces elasticus]KAK4910615.1 hypothetical protein LTR49_020747 [Elasticomyces elasticus]KAK5751026.1 hypothetical protein LTS12_018927 [Elasticomyces elasticus]
MAAFARQYLDRLIAAENTIFDLRGTVEALETRLARPEPNNASVLLVQDDSAEKDARLAEQEAEITSLSDQLANEVKQEPIDHNGVADPEVDESGYASLPEEAEVTSGDGRPDPSTSGSPPIRPNKRKRATSSTANTEQPHRSAPKKVYDERLQPTATGAEWRHISEVDFDELSPDRQQHWLHVARLTNGEGVLAAKPCHRCTRPKQVGLRCLVYPSTPRDVKRPMMRCAACLRHGRTCSAQPPALQVDGDDDYRANTYEQLAYIRARINAIAEQ